MQNNYHNFQGVNRLFVKAFEDYAQRTSKKIDYLPNLEIKDYSVMIDGKNFFDQPIKNNKITYENRKKSGQADNYISGCLLDYTHFRDIYKMIAIDLSKSQALDSDHKAIQQINFAANLDRIVNTRIFFILLEETKETVFDFWQGTVKIL